MNGFHDEFLTLFSNKLKTEHAKLSHRLYVALGNEGMSRLQNALKERSL